MALESSSPPSSVRTAVPPSKASKTGASKAKGKSGPRVSWKLPSARQMGFGLFGLLVAAAIAFYVAWGISFHVWIDNGMYAIVATLAGFGLAGMWLTLPPRRASASAA